MSSRRLIDHHFLKMIVIGLARGSRDVLSILQSLKVRRAGSHLRRRKLSSSTGICWFGKSFRCGRVKASSRGDKESSSCGRYARDRHHRFFSMSSCGLL